MAEKIILSEDDLLFLRDAVTQSERHRLLRNEGCRDEQYSQYCARIRVTIDTIMRYDRRHVYFLGREES